MCIRDRACLERGRTALLLAPEVALALKLRRDAEARFPGLPVFLFHGYQSPARRERTFRELAARREPCVVVGTRSALFLPLPELGLMVLDEEHDASFKQDEGLHLSLIHISSASCGQIRTSPALTRLSSAAELSGRASRSLRRETLPLSHRYSSTSLWRSALGRTFHGGSHSRRHISPEAASSLSASTSTRPSRKAAPSSLSRSSPRRGSSLR